MEGEPLVLHVFMWAGAVLMLSMTAVSVAFAAVICRDIWRRY